MHGGSKMALEFDNAVGSLSMKVKNILLALPPQIKEKCFEVRIRVNSPIMLTMSGEQLFVSGRGTTSRIYHDGFFLVSKFDISECFKAICEYSVHSHQQEINNGFITLTGGHRVGICGTSVTENDKIINIKDISSLNLRIAKQIYSAGDEVVTILKKKLAGTVIIGQPSSGKTTVLRDVIRQLSIGVLGYPLKVALIDERGELSATAGGVPQNNIGPSCDCLFGYPKAIGMNIAVRTLSPDVIVFDEIGTSAELSAVTESLHSGVTVITSIHAGSEKDFLQKNIGKALVECGAFENFVFLKSKDEPSIIKSVVAREVFLNEIGRTNSDFYLHNASRDNAWKPFKRESFAARGSH